MFRYPPQCSGRASVAPGTERTSGARPDSALPRLRPDLGALATSGLGAAWLGHATVLLRLGDAWILTDPALQARIGIHLGLGTVGPRRLTQPALTALELPPIDLVLISHAHMDHLDLGTLRHLPRSTPVVTQTGLGDLLRRFESVTELRWGERTTVGAIEIEALPARHWGARLITDRHRGYGGFLLEGAGRRVVYTGDTAFTDRFGALRQRGPVDLGIVPIGAYDPWIDNHASPEQAWTMGRMMGATHLLPVHHSTFRLSQEPMDEPIHRFLAAAGTESWRIALTRIGESWRVG